MHSTIQPADQIQDKSELFLPALIIDINSVTAGCHSVLDGFHTAQSSCENSSKKKKRNLERMALNYVLYFQLLLKSYLY